MTPQEGLQTYDRTLGRADTSHEIFEAMLQLDDWYMWNPWSIPYEHYLEVQRIACSIRLMLKRGDDEASAHQSFWSWGDMATGWGELLLRFAKLLIPRLSNKPQTCLTRRARVTFKVYRALSDVRSTWVRTRVRSWHAKDDRRPRLPLTLYHPYLAWTCKY